MRFLRLGGGGKKNKAKKERKPLKNRNNIINTFLSYPLCACLGFSFIYTYCLFLPKTKQMIPSSERY